MNPTESTPSYTYYVGGSLEINDPTYVTRQADQDFYESLRAGNFCYVFNSRQMGKSSLKVRTMQRLQSEGFACASIYITATGSQNITADKWYAGIMRGLVNGLGLESRINLRDWLRERDMLPPVQRFSEFIETVILREIAGRVVIFIDEIDSVLSLDFGIDDFFAVIRECADRRGGQPEYKRLTFALLGVIAPADLIKDKRRTPFNTARQAIDLTGFTLEEAQPLALGFQGQADNPQAVLRSVLDWTGGQPFLTQKVCMLVSAVPGRIVAGAEEALVERVIREQVVERWEEQDVPEHLKTISDRLLRGNSNEQVKGRLLGLYQQILESSRKDDPPQPPLRRGEQEENSKPPFLRGVGGIEADESYEQMQLRLTGLVVKRGGRLVPYNHIYTEIFNATWISRALRDLRPDFYAEVFEKWREAGEDQKRNFLLKGEKLEKAEEWSDNKQLSYMDVLFLRESQGLRLETIRKAQEMAEVKLTTTEKKNKRNTWLGSIFLVGVLTISGIVGMGAIRSITEQNNNLKDVWDVSSGESNRQQGKYDEAIEILNKIIEANPRNTFALVSRGITYSNKGDHAKAEADFRAAIKIDSRYAIAYNSLGVTLRDQNKLDEAIVAYRKAIEFDPKYAFPYNNLGLALREKNKLDESVAAYRKAVEIDPKFAGAYNNLGSVLQEQNKLDEAIFVYRKAIEVYPEYAFAYNGLGNVLKAQNKLDESIAAYRKAIEIAPKLAVAYNNLGNVLQEQNKLDEAIAAYRKAIEIYPKYSFAYSGMGNILYEQNNPDEAIVAYEKAINFDPKNTYAFSGMGNVLLKQKKLDEAITAYRKAIEIDPKNSFAYSGLGVALYGQKKLDEAIATYRKAIEIDPKNAITYNNLGNALYNQKKLEEAIAAYRKSIELDPKYAIAYNNLGNVLSDQKKLNEAITAYRKAIDITPTYTYAYSGIGNILYEQNKLDEAISMYKKATEIDSQNTYAYRGIGNILLKQNKLDEAIIAYKKAIEIDPKYVIVYNHLCWTSGIAGKAQEILSDCDKGVELAPLSDKGAYHDSRGLARATTGNVAGAIEDFEAYLKWLETSSKSDSDKARYREQRLQWVKELRDGKPPSEIFTKEILEELRNE